MAKAASEISAADREEPSPRREVRNFASHTWGSPAQRLSGKGGAPRHQGRWVKRKSIRHSSKSDHAETDAQLTFRTYFTYVDAFRLLCENLDKLKAVQRTLPDFQNLFQRNSIPIDLVRGSLHRGLVNFQVMRSIPLRAFPECALTANVWSPVQAYYAVHGVGLAAFAALTGTCPSTHGKFLSKATNDLVPLLPFPFSIICEGNPWNSAGPRFEISGSKLQATEVRNTANLSTANASNAECLAVKAIMTSHTHRFKDDCADFKARKGIQRLTPSQARQLAPKVSPSSIFHFLYRLRLRSNYDDPMMFMAGQPDAGIATIHYMNLHKITHVFLSLLLEILYAVVDSSDVAKMREIYGRYSSRFPRPDWPTSR